MVSKQYKNQCLAMAQIKRKIEVAKTHAEKQPLLIKLSKLSLGKYALEISGKTDIVCLTSPTDVRRYQEKGFSPKTW
jgi:hypothetical protein